MITELLLLLEYIISQRLLQPWLNKSVVIPLVSPGGFASAYLTRLIKTLPCLAFPKFTCWLLSVRLHRLHWWDASYKITRPPLPSLSLSACTHRKESAGEQRNNVKTCQEMCVGIVLVWHKYGAFHWWPTLSEGTWGRMRRTGKCYFIHTHTHAHTQTHTGSTQLYQFNNYCHWANYERQLVLLTWQGKKDGGRKREREGCFYFPQHNISRFASWKLDRRGSFGVSWEIKCPHMGVLVT